MKQDTPHEAESTAGRPRPPLSIRISEELDAKLTQAVTATNLKRSDVARLSLEKGLPIFMEQMTGQAA